MTFRLFLPAALALIAVAPAFAQTAAPQISVDTLKEVDRTLSSDEYEGRAPTTHGEELTINYIRQRFEQAGLQPGNHGNWFQDVPLAENTASPTPLAISGGREPLTFTYRTDFVANTDAFRLFVKDMAMQVAASRPLYVSPEEIPAAEIEHEREILRAQALGEGKPEKIVDKMVDGRIQKYYKDVCLLEQPFIKDQDKAVKDILAEQVAKIGEKISVRRFVRYEMGEGLEKRQDNFAEEVAAQMGK